jgi:hypothetical protein
MSEKTGQKHIDSRLGCPYTPSGFCPKKINCNECFYLIKWKVKCTCNECEDVLRCPFAYDLYNTNGDCLASK